MKKWIIPGVIVSVLLASTLGLLGVFFFTELSAVFSPEAVLPTTTLYDMTTAQDTSVTDGTTQPGETTAPQDTTVPEDTTAPEDTAVQDTTVPPETTTPPVTTVPPDTTAPPETTTPPVTTVPPETTVPPATTLPPTTQPAVTTQPSQEISAGHAFVYDCASGEYLYIQGGLNDRICFASITKLFTAYVALQYLSPEAVVTAGEEVTWIDPLSSRAWIYQGQQLTAETLVGGMLLPSGNDAAYIIAVAAGRAIIGDPELPAADALAAFIGEMNSQAQAQGLTGTHFATPDGIDADDHYSTMGDLAAMAQYAMENPIIRKYAAAATASGTYVSGETYSWNNSNQLLHPDSEYYCPEACGLKTGNTSKAGKCQITAFRQGDSYLLIGVFGCSTFDSRSEDTLYLYGQYK